MEEKKPVCRTNSNHVLPEIYLVLRNHTEMKRVLTPVPAVDNQIREADSSLDLSLCILKLHIHVYTLLKIVTFNATVYTQMFVSATLLPAATCAQEIRLNVTSGNV